VETGKHSIDSMNPTGDLRAPAVRLLVVRLLANGKFRAAVTADRLDQLLAGSRAAHPLAGRSAAGLRVIRATLNGPSRPVDQSLPS
jgi:hypothetical protein